MTTEEMILALANAINELRSDANLDSSYSPFLQVEDVIRELEPDDDLNMGLDEPTRCKRCDALIWGEFSHACRLAPRPIPRRNPEITSSEDFLQS